MSEENWCDYIDEHFHPDYVLSLIFHSSSVLVLFEFFAKLKYINLNLRGKRSLHKQVNIKATRAERVELTGCGGDSLVIRLDDLSGSF